MTTTTQTISAESLQKGLKLDVDLEFSRKLMNEYLSDMTCSLPVLVAFASIANDLIYDINDMCILTKKQLPSMISIPSRKAADDNDCIIKNADVARAMMLDANLHFRIVNKNLSATRLLTFQKDSIMSSKKDDHKMSTSTQTEGKPLGRGGDRRSKTRAKEGIKREIEKNGVFQSEEQKEEDEQENGEDEEFQVGDDGDDGDEESDEEEEEETEADRAFLAPEEEELI